VCWIPGVVHQDVGAAPGRHGLHQPVDPVGVAQVAVEELHMRRPLVAQVVADLLDLRVAGDAMDRDPRTGPGQRLGDRKADPLHGAGHERRLPVKIGHGLSSLRRSRSSVFRTLP
jgi:hypothetical protein